MLCARRNRDILTTYNVLLHSIDFYALITHYINLINSRKRR